MSKAVYPDPELGARYGRWQVVGSPLPGKGRYTPCRCECGVERAVTEYDLRKGKSVSCGCWQRENMPWFRHGRSHTPIYRVWQNMRARCYDRKNVAYSDYGGRGITVCDEWRDVPDVFIEWALGSGYADGLHIDRIDNDAGYSPSNCRWVTRTQNNRNRRSARLVEAFGETKSVAEWADDPRCVVGYDALYTRIHRGFPVERSMTTPLRSRRELWSGDVT